LKIFTFILTFFICTSSFGQFDKLKGIWVTPSQDLLIIDDTAYLNIRNYLSNTVLEENNFLLFLYGDTLSFQSHYTSSKTDFKVEYIDRYDFKTLKVTDSILMVKPTSKLAKDFYQNREEIIFTRQKYAIDSSIIFQKVAFHTTLCYGECPVYNLEIDSSGLAKLNAIVVYKTKSYQHDTSAQGNFTGQLSAPVFKNLIDVIKTSNLKTLRMNESLCCDGVIYTIVIYFNGQKKYFKTMTPPMIANNLIITLLDICKNNGLQRTQENLHLKD
jgi:Domain of unknown function (DUF6438)